MKTIAYWDIKGVWSAAGVMAAWAVCLSGLLHAELVWTTFAFGIPLQTFLYTGLFITAHDAMHGTVSPKHPRVNDAVGWVAVALYALFSFSGLRTWHHDHHKSPGVPHDDPDFHDGKHTGFWAWYFHFLRHYVTWKQLVGMALVFNALHHLAGFSLVHLLAFWVMPSLLSTLQLFFFGTYLPHRGHPSNPHHARSNAYPPWLSFLTCYHFGYHLEHHESPWAPWWHLPTVRAEGLKSTGPTARAR